MKRTIIGRSIPILAIALLLGACSSKPQAGSVPAVPVTIETVASTAVQDTSEFTARIQAKQLAEIRPQINGEVLAVYVELGDVVGQGDLLFEIDGSQQQAVVDARSADVRAAEANRANAQAGLQAQEAERTRIVAELNYNSEVARLADAEATLRAGIEDRNQFVSQVEFARTEEERWRTLWQQGVVSERRYDGARRSREVAEAQLAAQDELIDSQRASVESARRDLERKEETIRAQLAAQDEVIQSEVANIASAQRQVDAAAANERAAAVQLGYYQVLAPFSGVVGEVLVKAGDVVSPQVQLTSLNETRPLEILIDVPVNRSAQIRVGTLVELIDRDGEVIGTSQVSFVSPQANPGTQTILVKAIYGNAQGNLRSDERLRVRVIWEEQPGLTIPFAAVTRLGGQPFVFVVGENPDAPAGETNLIALQKPIELGSLQGGNYEVLSGLEANDRIVVSGVQKLRDQTPIVSSAETNTSQVDRTNEETSE
ncbi:MAG: efflux RND transporter periplasmic adaptor subunit [Cyanobacteria bacterium SID2]|nr:efflux RND transporter periplasmic adaptor subunit [Cyanobacteria bacterium SID2]MBP0005775.1 efflux RND transporter periplasmic adaptor subunit [Cyanobacteria bacterium SBC]